MEQRLIQSEILNKIKQIILDTANKYNIKIHKIILFGSRARGDYNEYSDWDILIVTEEKLDKELEDKFYLEVGRKLVKLNIVPEIIISSKEELDEYSKYYGYIHYHAIREGIEL